MELLKKLTRAFGPSGNEDRVAEIIMEEIKPYVDEVRRDRLGNVIALKKGNGKGKIMMAAHMDQIGLMITEVEKEGFLRFVNVGGVSPHVILGHNVIFANGTTGVISMEGKKKITELRLGDMYIDIGAASKEEAVKSVKIGDFGVFASNFVVNGDSVSSGAMDNRVSCYIQIEAAKRMKQAEYDAYFVFTVQEETFQSGAATSAYTIEPDAAIVVDVTATGDTPNCPRMAVKLGNGAAIKIMDRGMITHPMMKKFLEETAIKHNIKFQFEVLEFGGTDGMEIHVSKAGVPTGVLSIPTRYIHTPTEMISLSDVENVIELLVKAIEDYR